MREEIGYVISRTLVILVLIVVLMILFGDLAFGSTGSGSLFLPLIYGGAASTPSPSPTPTMEPTSTPKPTPTPVPGELWTWVARAGDVGDTTEIYAVIPGYCCELIGQKSGKIIYVQAVCPAEPACEIFQPPAVIPPPFAWGDVEKLIYDADSKQVCSAQWPFNCEDVK
jgi:hypothetical protein